MRKAAPREKGPDREDFSGRILDLLDQGVALVNDAGEIVLFNSMMEQISGMKRGEVLGMTIRDFISAGIVPRLTGDQEGERGHSRPLLRRGRE